MEKQKSVSGIPVSQYFLWAAGIAALVWIFFESARQNDFRIYLHAASDLLAGKNIYTEYYNTWFHYLYSPVFALLLYPFTFLPVQIIQFCWLLAGIILLIRSWKIILNICGFDFGGRNREMIMAVLFLVFSARFIRENIHFGQVTILVLWISLEGFRMVSEGKNIYGSLLLALGIMIKVYPVIFIPYFLYRGNFKAACFILLFSMMLLFIPAFFIGNENNFFLLGEWWKVINPLNHQHLVDTDETSFHSLTTLIPTLLMDHVPDIHALNLKRNILSLPEQTVIIILNTIRFLIVLLFLFVLRSKPFRPAAGMLNGFYEFSYLLLIVPLIFPHQQAYSFLLCVPASVYLAIVYQKTGSKSILFFLLTAAIIFNASLLLGTFRDYYEHYKIITYAALVMLIIFLCYPPVKLIKS